MLRGGTLYAVGGASLHAIDAATGSERWQQPQPGAGLVVVDSTLLLVGANEISAIEAASGQVLSSAAASGITTDPVVTKLDNSLDIRFGYQRGPPRLIGKDL